MTAEEIAQSERDATEAQAREDAAASAPDPDAEFRAAVSAATTLAALKAALLGMTGPGAEARRPTGT